MMDPLTILSAVTTAIGVAKQLVALGQDVAPLLSKTYDVLVKGDKVTEQDLDALVALTEKNSVELQVPIPDEKP